MYVIIIWYNITEAFDIMKIIRFFENDKLVLKKTHPCGSNTFTALRVGSDVRIVCDGCGKEMTLDRIKLEKAIRKVISAKEEQEI